MYITAIGTLLENEHFEYNSSELRVGGGPITFIRSIHDVV